MTRQVDVAVIGGGLVGLATAYKLLGQDPRRSVVVLEKEPDVGRHQSTHNSGVLHCGLHYKPGSLKARLAVGGVREMVAYCESRSVKFERCGKLVVATDELERERLQELMARGTANGLTGLRWLEGDAIRELEPNAAGICGLHVPEEGIVDYAAVCAALKADISGRGGQVMLNAGVRSLQRRAGRWHVATGAGEIDAAQIVNCAGLHSDRVARLAGEQVEERIVPFRGEYWTLKPEREHLVRNLIYPVPDPAFPFLGVHLTRMIHGGVEAGPNAVLALARQGYRWSTINPRDLADSLSFPGLWRFIARYPRIATYEIARSFSRAMFVRSLQKLVPALTSDDIVRGPAGVRAQVMNRAGELVQDFLLRRSDGAVHVVNAPSPAATASLAIGGEIARLVAA